MSKDPFNQKLKVAFEMKIQLYLDMITLDNFDTIKEKIQELAAENIENCKKVAEFIIENALTQKQDVNIYAKLCHFLGRSEKLYLEGDPKMKNSFKIHILKLIQNILEEESHLTFGIKKTFGEINDEEKSLFFTRKKQIFLGQVSFIGELFLEKFLVIGIIRIVTNVLLQIFLDGYAAHQKAFVKPKIRPHEVTLEGLLKFYEIIGKAVEDREASSIKGLDKAKSSNCVTVFQKALEKANSGNGAEPKITPNDAISLDDLFKIFSVMLTKADLSIRLYFLVKSLIYRRENIWAAARYETFQEIFEELQRRNDLRSFLSPLEDLLKPDTNSVPTKKLVIPSFQAPAFIPGADVPEKSSQLVLTDLDWLLLKKK